MGSSIIGQRWEVYNYDSDIIKTRVPKKGEMFVIKNTPQFGTVGLALVGDGEKNVVQLYQFWDDLYTSPEELAEAIEAHNTDTNSHKITVQDDTISDALPATNTPLTITSLFQKLRDNIKFLFEKKANIESPTFTGIPRVPNKNDGPVNDGMLIATEAQVYNEAQARANADAQLQTNLDNEAATRTNADAQLDERISRVENMGDYVGAFNTYALLPKNISGFPQGITVNDFTTIRADETNGNATTRYVVSSIAPDGTITWTYDLTYTGDISGKTDKVANAANNNFAALDAGGNLKDSGKKPADFAPANAALTAESGTGTDVATGAVASASVASILQSIWGKIRQVVNAKADKSHTHAIADTTNLQTTLDGKASLSGLLKMANIQTGNLFFEGNWSFSSSGVLTKGNSLDDRLISLPVDKTQSTTGLITWVNDGAAWPTITGLGSTPNIAGGYSITIPKNTAIIGRHTKGGNHTAVALYALVYNQTNSTELLQPGDIILCARPPDTPDILQLGNGLAIGRGVSIVNGGVSNSISNMVNIQTGNLIFGGDWSFSSLGVLTKGSTDIDRLTSIPVSKAQSSSGLIDWVTYGAPWPAITGLGSTPNIAGGYSITIPPLTAIIGRHTRGGDRHAVALYALVYNQTNSTELLQPGDIILCARIPDIPDILQLGNGLVIGRGVSIVNGIATDSNKANTASPTFTGTPTCPTPSMP